MCTPKLVNHNLLTHLKIKIISFQGLGAILLPSNMQNRHSYLLPNIYLIPDTCFNTHPQYGVGVEDRWSAGTDARGAGLCADQPHETRNLEFTIYTHPSSIILNKNSLMRLPLHHKKLHLKILTSKVSIIKLIYSFSNSCIDIYNSHTVQFSNTIL